MSEELKPCPSCSGKPFIDFMRSPMGIRYNSVVCKECGLGTKFYCDASKQKAYDSWNTRATPTFTKEDVEKAWNGYLLKYERITADLEFADMSYQCMIAALNAVGRVEK